MSIGRKANGNFLLGGERLEHHGNCPVGVYDSLLSGLNNLQVVSKVS